MAEGAGELAGIQMAWLALKFTGEKIDPQTLNPYRTKTKPNKSKEQTEMELARKWQLFEKALSKRR